MVLLNDAKFAFAKVFIKKYSSVYIKVDQNYFYDEIRSRYDFKKKKMVNEGCRAYFECLNKKSNMMNFGVIFKF